VIEAKQLMKMDVGVLGMGKSDPYAIINVGSQEFRTKTINNTIHPRWDFYCEVNYNFDCVHNLVKIFKKQKLSFQVILCPLHTNLIIRHIIGSRNCAFLNSKFLQSSLPPPLFLVVCEL
jgi:hypothetical protein